MGSKISSILEKAAQERRRGDYDKALKRLKDATGKMRDEILLYQEGIDTALEAGESLQAIAFFKTAVRHIPSRYDELWSLGMEKVKSFNDPIFCKFLLDQAIKKRDFEAAEDVLTTLKDHTAAELLKRTRTKRQTLTTAGVGNHAFKGEMIANALAEAMLYLRSNRFQEAAKTLVQVLDDKPVENEGLTPYLTGLERKYAKKGGIKYALGCSCLYGEQYSKGVSKLVHGVSRAPTYADDAIERLEALVDVANVPRDHIRYALAKVMIIKGDEQNAAERLREILLEDSKEASAVLDVIEPHLGKTGDSLVLNYLFVEAALKAGSSSRALVQLRNIYQDRRNRGELLSWMDARASEQSLPADIMTYFGEIALEQEMYEKSIEIFRELLSQSPHEAHHIRELVAGHRKNAVVKTFFEELGEPGEEPVDDDGFTIEHFGGRDFTLDSHTGKRHLKKKTIDPKPEKPEAPEAAENEDTASAGEAREAAAKSVSQNDREESTENATWEEEAAPTSGGGDSEPTPDEKAPGKPPVIAAGWQDDGTGQEADTPPPDPPAEKDESEAEAVGSQPEPAAPRKTRTAAKSSEADNAAESADLPGTPKVIILGAPQGAAARPSEKSAPTVDAEAARDFDELYKAFENGDLGNREILDLIKRASQYGRIKEMKKLLGFRPKNVGQDIKRKYYLAEYYLRDDQPLSALVILKSVHLNGLSKEQRITFLLKIAYCYQQLSRFDAAHSVYLKIMAEDPDFAVAEDMAKINYQKYLQSSAGGAPILEKVTTLDKVVKEEEER